MGRRARTAYETPHGSGLVEIRGKGIGIPEGHARIWLYRPRAGGWRVERESKGPVSLADAVAMRRHGTGGNHRRVLQWIPERGGIACTVIAASCADALELWNTREDGTAVGI